MLNFHNWAKKKVGLCFVCEGAKKENGVTGVRWISTVDIPDKWVYYLLPDYLSRWFPTFLMFAHTVCQASLKQEMDTSDIQ